MKGGDDIVKSGYHWYQFIFRQKQFVMSMGVYATQIR